MSIATMLAERIPPARAYPSFRQGQVARDGIGPFQLAFRDRKLHIGGGRLARDVSLANRVRSGRKQP